MPPSQDYRQPDPVVPIDLQTSAGALPTAQPLSRPWLRVAIIALGVILMVTGVVFGASILINPRVGTSASPTPVASVAPAVSSSERSKVADSVTGQTSLDVTNLTAQNGDIVNLLAKALQIAGDTSLQGNLAVQGNMNIVGAVTAGSLAGSGSGITGVNAALLGGQPRSYYESLASSASAAAAAASNATTNAALRNANNTFTASNTFISNVTVTGTTVLGAATASSLVLSAPLSAASGGTGLGVVPARGVLYGQGGPTLAAAVPAGAGLCLLSGVTDVQWGSCAAGGSVASLNGLTGALSVANATGSGATITINDASTAQKGIAQFNATNFTVAAGVVNTIQNIATTSSPTFAGLTLTTALPVASGGTGVASLTNNGLVLGQGAGALATVTAGGVGLCLISTAGAPSFQACPGGGAVTSVNGQAGAVTVANATGSGGTVTIDDATTAAKGIASFNASNFSVAAGAVNTVQNIGASASPTFAGINTNSLTPSGPLSVGATSQALTLQGSNTTLTATNGANLAQLTFVAPTANVTYRLQTAAAGTYDVCTTAGNCVGVGGSVSTSGGSANVIPKYTSASAIGPSLLTDNGTLVTVGGNLSVTGTAIISSTVTLSALNSVGVVQTNGSGNLSTGNLNLATGPVTGQLGVGNGGTGSGTAGGARTNLGAAASGANSDITSLSGLTTALSVLQGGTGATSLTQHGVLIGNGTSAISSLATASSGLCLVSGGTGVDPSWQACPGGGGVTDVNGQTGSVTIANASGSGGTVTINDATTAAKGIASFNSTNFTTSSGAVNTIQNIATTSSPTFAGVNTNAITPSAALTVGAAAQQISLQGNASSTFAATNAGNTTTLGFATPTANTTLNLPALAAGAYTLCTSSGNCAGTGGGVTTAGGTTGALAKFSGAQTIADSIISDNGTTVTVAGAGIIQGSGGLTLGTASGNNGKIVFQNSTNGNTTTLQSGAAGSNLAFTLPVADGSAGDCLTTNSSGVLSFSPCLSGAGGGSGGVTSLNGLSGVLSVANASGSGGTVTINDASTAQKGIAQFNSTNFSAASGAINTIQDIASTASPSFAGATLTGAGTALSVTNNAGIGGTLNVTGAGGVTIGNATSVGQLGLRDGSSAFAATFQSTTLTTNRTITVPNAGGTLAVSASGNIALSATGDISFTGQLPIANGGTNANTAAGARTNLGAAASGANADITNTTALNTITPSAALAIGATSQQFTLQGNASSTVTATNAGSTTTLSFQTPTANVTYRLPTAAVGSYDFCTTAGNCPSGGNVSTAGGSTNAIPKFTAGTTLGDSNISDNGTTVSIAANANFLQNGTGTFGTGSGAVSLNGATTVAQLLTGQLGATISGATISLNASSNFATNINTGSSTGAVSIGNGAAGAIAVQSGSTISLAGVGIALNSASITTNQTTVDLLNATASTVNAFGAAGSIIVGAPNSTTALLSDVLFLGNSGVASIIGGTDGSGFEIVTKNESAAAANSGYMWMSSGGVSGAGANSGNTGIGTGDSSTSGNTGDITLTTGDAANGNSGSIWVDTGGAAGGTHGAIGIGGTNAGGLDLGRSGITTTINGTLVLQNALSVANGGTGATTLTANGVLLGNGTSAISSLATATSGQCLISGGTGVDPSWQSCPGGGAVTSVNSQTGAVTIANASGSGGTVTINDATTAAKGIASFNSTNFSASAGAVNTIQNINSTATPTFGGITLNGAYLQKSDSATAFLLQDSTGANNRLALDATTNTLKVYDTATTNYASISYASGTATFAANTGLTQIGNGTGDVTLSTANNTEKINLTHTGTNAGSTDSDTVITRNLTGTTNALAGNVLKVEDLSSFTSGGSSAPDVLYVNQNNTSATGNLIVARTGGVNDKFKVDTTGTVTIAAGQSYTGAGALTVASGAGMALSLTGNAASTWQTTSGNLTVDAAAVLNLGSANATSLTIGRSGITTTINGTLALQNALTPANGGTGLTSYTTGDLLYASGSSTLSKLSDVATGSCLISGGVGVAPGWGSCTGSSGITTPGGTTNAIPKFTSGTTLGDSSISDNGTTVTVASILALNGNTTLAAGKTLNMSAASAGTILQNVQVTGDTTPRLQVAADGTLSFGSGSGAADAVIARSAAGRINVTGQLQTSDDIRISKGATAYIGTVDAQALSLTTNGNPALTIQNGGNVGIGNTAAPNKLTLNTATTADGAAQLLLATAGTGNKGVVVQGASGQTANLFELQGNNGNINAAFNAAGNQLTLGRSQATGTNTTGALALVYGGNTNGFGATLQSGAVGANRTFTFGDQGGTVCTDSVASCGGTTGAYVALQGSTPGTAQTGNINISGTFLAAATTNTPAATITGYNGANAQPSLVVTAAPSSTNNNILEVHRSDGTTGFAVWATGDVYANSLFSSLNQTGDTADAGLRSGNSTSGASGNANIDTGTAATTTGGVNIGTVSASSITLGRSGITTTSAGALFVASNQTLTANGAALFKDATNSTTALQIQNAAGTTNLLTADTTNNLLVTGVNQESIGYYNNGYGGIGQFSNLLLYSEQFNNAAWTKTSASATADATAAPDAQTTADTVHATGSGGKLTQAYASAGNNTYTFSVWLKTAASTQNVDLRIDSNGTPATGTAKTISANTTWTRYFVTQTFSGATTSITAALFPGTASGTDTQTVYAWGAQLVQGSDMQAYARSTAAVVAANQGVVSNGGALFTSLNASDTVVKVVASPAQSGGLLQITDANNTNIMGVDAGGNLFAQQITSNDVVIANSYSTTHNAFQAVQNAASATVPVAYIRGGATPGAGADLLQLQTSTPVTVFKVDSNGLITAAPAASLTNGQALETQTATFANATGSGVVRGKQSTFTVVSATAATNKGTDLTVTDNSSSVAHVNYGVQVTMNGTNASQGQVGVTTSTARGTALQGISSGAGTSGTACDTVTGAFGACVGMTGSGSGAGLYGYNQSSSIPSSFDTTANGAGVYGINDSSGAVASGYYYGVKGVSVQSGGSPYNSIGVGGIASGSQGLGYAYGGYFTIPNTNNAANGAALYASTQGFASATSSGTGLNAPKVLQASGGAGQSYSGTGSNLAGAGAAISLTSGDGGAATGASGANTAGSGGAIYLQGGNGGAATSGTGGAGSNITLTAGNGGNGSTTGGAGGNVTLTAGAAGTGGTPTTGSTIVKNTDNSTTAFQVQDTSGNSQLTVDTLNHRVNSAELTVGNYNGLGYQSGRLFTDNFEGGLGPVDLFGYGANNYAGFSLDSSVKHGGRNSLHINETGTATNVTNPVWAAGTNEIYIRSYVYVYSSSTDFDIMASDTNNWTNFFSVWRENSTKHLCLWNSITATTYCSTQVMPDGSWHKLEFHILLNGGSGKLELMYDGSTIKSVTVNTGTGAVDTVIIGDTNAGDTASYNYDDIAADTVPTGDDASLSVTDSFNVAGTSMFSGNVLVQAPATPYAFDVEDSSGVSVFEVDTETNYVKISGADYNSVTLTQRLCHTGGDNVANDLILGDCKPTGQADLAEFYPTEGNPEPGDIVVPTGTSSLTVTQSSTQYQNNIIGAISTNPTADGIMGFSVTSPTRQPVALAGRIPVKVSTINGDIHTGDPLTTSSIPGVAMKATQPGRIIGTALEDYVAGSPRVSSLVAAEETDRSKSHPDDLAAYKSDPTKWAAGVGKIMVVTNVSYYDPSNQIQAVGSQMANLQNRVTQLEDTQGTLSKADLLISGTATTHNLTVTGTATIQTLAVVGDVTVGGNMVVTGTVTTGAITVNGHIATTGAAPTIAAAPAAGKTATATITGTDTAGLISLTTGSASLAIGKLLDVTFAQAYGAAPHIVLTPANSQAAAFAQTFVNAATVSTTAFDLDSNLAPTASTTYQWYYQVIQ